MGLARLQQHYQLIKPTCIFHTTTKPDEEPRSPEYSLKQMGYNGSYPTTAREIRPFKERGVIAKIPKLHKFFWSPRKASLLLCKKTDSLSNDEREMVTTLCQSSAEIHRTCKLAHIFREMMEVKNGKYLYLWTDLVIKETLDIKELKTFANGLHKDYNAVVNALSLPYSNGQVEGQINKLKTIKRQMYGRASFEFLRRRLLLSSA